MKKIIVLSTLLIIVSFIFIPHTHAQMMMNSGNPSVSVDPTEIEQQQQEEAQGKQFFDDLQNKQTTCVKLTDSDFEKIGEYTMSQMFGDNTTSHIAMNDRIKQMRGDTGEEQMHIQIGRSVTGCTSTPQNEKSIPPKTGAVHMIGWGSYGMMGNLNGGNSGIVLLAVIAHLVFIFVLILLGVWLWQQIKKNRKK